MAEVFQLLQIDSLTLSHFALTVSPSLESIQRKFRAVLGWIMLLVPATRSVTLLMPKTSPRFSCAILEIIFYEIAIGVKVNHSKSVGLLLGAGSLSSIRNLPQGLFKFLRISFSPESLIRIIDEYNLWPRWNIFIKW